VLFACLACTENSPVDDSSAHAGSSSATGGASSATGGASSATGGSLSGSGAAGTPVGQGGVAGESLAGTGAGGTAPTAGSLGEVGGVSGSAGSASNSGAAGTAGSGTQEPPKVVLFDGGDLAAWKSRDGGGAAPWTTTDGAAVVVPGSGDIQTRQTFGDIQLHVEFWIPKTPTSNEEQDRGNSGIYLQGRYEVQVLDSYQHPLDGANDCGAIYELKNADVNAALPPETWQTYEITFHAPRWSGQTKTANARISVIWNGQQAQSDVEVPAPTRLGDAEAPGAAALRLQDHNHAVRYRNLWLREL
jgi:hypothetical protein